MTKRFDRYFIETWNDLEINTKNLHSTREISFDDTPHLASVPFIASCESVGLWDGVGGDGGELPMTNAFILINGVVRYLLIFQIGAIIPTLCRPLTPSRVFIFPSAHWVRVFLCSQIITLLPVVAKAACLFAIFIYSLFLFFFFRCPFGNTTFSTLIWIKHVFVRECRLSVVNSNSEFS